MKRIVVILILFVQVSFVRAQKRDSLMRALYWHWEDSIIHYKDSVRVKPYSITVSTDLMQYFLDQPNVSIEYRKKNFEFGLNIGYVFPTGDTVNVLANGQYKMPATMYDGWAFRLSSKFYIAHRPRRYMALQAVVKDLWFNNKNFSDMPGHYPVNYNMSEKSTVLGLEFLIGHKEVYKCGLSTDFFVGIGFHARLMNYTINSVNIDYSSAYDPGGHYYVKTYPTPIIGFKVGYTFSYKKS